MTTTHRGTEALRAFLLFVLLLALLGAGPSADLTLVDAVKAGNGDAVRALLRGKADSNSAEPDGTTALHWAVQRGDVAMADLLLKAGATVGAANRYGVTPLSLAATNAQRGDGRAIARRGRRSR